MILLEQFISCSEEFEYVFLLLDAFDECDNDQQEAMLSLIHQFKSQSSIRIMLASQPHLQKLGTLSECAITINLSASDSDVRTYLSFRLERERFLSQGLKSKIVEKVGQGVKGM